MTYLIEYLIRSIATQIYTAFPSYPVYASPNQQGTSYPCFFVFMMPSNISDQLSDISKREIFFDVVFVQERDAPNANMALYAIAETLDELFDTVTYTGDETESIVLHTHERNYSIDDQELHYKFKVIARVSAEETHTYMETLEENNVEIETE